MKNIFFFLLFLLSTFISAQSNIDAKDAIKQLKEGALVVNLIHQQKKIDALLNSGHKQESIELQKSTESDHQAMILAFANNYSFSTVYFIHSYNMGSLADGDPSALLDSAGNPVSTMPSHYFYIELTLSPTQNLTGFVIKDKDRDPLSKPFPYFQSQHQFLKFKPLTYVEMVTKLNTRLSAFYQKTTRK